MTNTTATKPKATKKATASPYHEPAKPSVVDFDNYTQEFWVPLWMVYPKPEQQRSKFLQSTINELAGSFEINGQQEAIEVMYRPLDSDLLSGITWDDVVVTPDEPPLRGRPLTLRRDAILEAPEGQTPCLMVKTGETRHRARIQAGVFKMIRVKIRPYVDGLDLEVQHGIENLNRQQLSPFDEMNYFGKLHHEYGLSIDQIAEKLGYSGEKKFRIAWRLKLLNLNSRWMEVMQNGGYFVEHKGKRKKIEVGGDPLRIAAEIVDYDPITGKEQPRHDLQDVLLDYIINWSTKHGKLLDKEMMKRMRDGFQKPAATSGELDMILPANETTDKAVDLLQKRINASWKQICDALKSQQDGSPEWVLGYMGGVQGEGYSRILADIEKKANALRKLVDEAVATNIAQAARKEADELLALGGEMSGADILAQIDD